LARSAERHFDGEFECGLGRGWLVEEQVSIAAQPVRQWTACIVVGPLAILASASAAALDAEAARPALLRVLSSLSAVP
jgi:hypothetical protein